MAEPTAGKYELIAPFWEEYTSKPGAPLDFVRHRRGDTVDLSAAEARRLVLAGAVKVPGDDDGSKTIPGREESKAPEGDGQPTEPVAVFDPTVGGNVDATLGYVGVDVERASAMLDLEETREGGARSTLVAKLEGIVQAGS